MNRRIRQALGRVLFVSGVGFGMLGTAGANSEPAVAAVNDYPTQARVEYVFDCMRRYGGENYNTLYGCVCAIDQIAARIPYANFVTTSTLAVMAKTPGERSAPFRDAPGGREAIKVFQAFLTDSEMNCGLKTAPKVAVTAPPANE